MMKKMTLYCALLILFFMNTSAVQALSLENQDNPTSFTVKILPWEQADRFIPNKSYFTIIDIETGMQFNVQRRAGNKHADVQPLTLKDTKIMKKIYNGKWSWKRRAILVQTKDQLLAASMHGMPHGAGALRNGFPGHFCVHFYGSTTHGSKTEDLSHKIMILQAGGKLEKYLNEIDPTHIIHIFEAMVNQGNRKILNKMIINEVSQEQVHKKFNHILFVSFDRNSLINYDSMDHPFIQHIIVKATIYKCDFSKEKKYIQFLFWKDLGSGRWMIDSNIAKQF